MRRLRLPSLPAPLPHRPNLPAPLPHRPGPGGPIGATLLALVIAACGAAEDAPDPDAPHYWGTGNEPGWTLEIGREWTVVVTDYGENRYEFTTPEPTVDPASGATSFRHTVDGREIAIEIREEACSDSMSGEAFPARVDLRIDGTTYPGCGADLGIAYEAETPAPR